MLALVRMKKIHIFLAGEGNSTFRNLFFPLRSSQSLTILKCMFEKQLSDTVSSFICIVLFSIVYMVTMICALLLSSFQ